MTAVAVQTLERASAGMDIAWERIGSFELLGALVAKTKPVRHHPPQPRWDASVVSTWECWRGMKEQPFHGHRLVVHHSSSASTQDERDILPSHEDPLRSTEAFRWSRGPDVDVSRDDGSREEVKLANQGGEATECESALLVYTKHLKDLVAKRADLGQGHPELHQRCVDLDA